MVERPKLQRIMVLGTESTTHVALLLVQRIQLT